MSEDQKLTFYEALSELQHDIGSIQKNQEVNVGKFKFKYADLSKIREAIREPMHKWGFSISQVMDDGMLITTLHHRSGESLKSSVKIPPWPDLKALGGSLTYLRRYSIASILNLVSEDDIDSGSLESAGHVFVKEEESHTITKKEVELLNEVLDGCGKEYREKVEASLSGAYGIEEYSEIPRDLYKRILKAAKERGK